MSFITVDPKESLFALLHPIFADCCDPDAIRYDLSTPFIVGNHVFATDGRIIVCSSTTPEIVAAFAAVPPGDGKRLKNPAFVYEPSGFLSDPLALPDAGMLAVCLLCEGTGEQGPYECEECGHEGDGEECPRCCGFGRGQGFRQGIDVGKSLLSHALFLLLCKHGATVYEAADNPDGKRALKFTISPDIEGRVMTMTRG